MEIIVGGRVSGKTHELVRMALEERKAGGNPIILVGGLLARDRIRELQQVLGEGKVSVITSVLPRGEPIVYGPVERGVYIDDLQEVLGRALGLPYAASIRAVTANALVRTPGGTRFEPHKPNPHIIDWEG